MMIEAFGVISKKKYPKPPKPMGPQANNILLASEGNVGRGHLIRILEDKDIISTKTSVEEDICGICLDPRVNNLKPLFHSQMCSHSFHALCICPWLKKCYPPNCPTCRRVWIHLIYIEDESAVIVME